MKISYQRIRNLTTKRLHTEMKDIYTDIEFIVGEVGIMTHHLPSACVAMEGWLKSKFTDPRFWDGSYDPKHEGEIDVQPMTEDEKAFFWKKFSELPHPFAV